MSKWNMIPPSDDLNWIPVCLGMPFSLLWQLHIIQTEIKKFAKYLSEFLLLSNLKNNA